MRPMPRAIDLRLAIILLVLLPLLSVFGVGGWILFAALEKRVEARLQEDIALIARTLKQPMARALDAGRYRATQQAWSSAYEFGRVYGVYVYDAGGDLITRADGLGGNQEFRANVADIRELAEDAEIGDYRSMGGEEVFSYFTPLIGAGGQVIGMLQVTRQVSEMRHDIGELRWQVFLVLFAAGIVSMAIVIVGHQLAIGRPLGLLTGAMDEVVAGKDDVRAIPRGPSEMMRLARRFNLMLEEIRDRDQKLKKQHQEQTHLSERLRQTEKYALAGRLAAGVAHELGTPLSVVDGHVQRLLRDERAGSSAHGSLLGIRSASRRMAEVVEHLLGLARSSSVPAVPVSISRLVRLAAADMRLQFEKAGTSFECGDHPPDVLVNGDQGRLREALGHLLRNALQAAGETGAVRLSWKPAGDSVEMMIEDSGAGLDAEDRERIFEPFFTTKKPGEGSGLGLAVVRGIVSDHDGSIAVTQSRLGGAAFALSLPLAGPA